MKRMSAIISPMGCLLIATMVCGCGLTSAQKLDVKRWEAEAVELGHPEIHYQEELNPSTAVGLGFLPFGVAGFYVHRPGLGVSGILVWPLSITWVPGVACRSAYNFNYDKLRREMTNLRAELAEADVQPDVEARLAELNALWKQGNISDAEYHKARLKALEQAQ